MKNPVKTFEVFIAANADKGFGLYLVGSSAIQRLRPRKRGTPTRSRIQRSAAGWSSGFSRSQRGSGKIERVNLYSFRLLPSAF
jgi:hypothetical protein